MEYLFPSTPGEYEMLEAYAKSEYFKQLYPKYEDYVAELINTAFLPCQSFRLVIFTRSDGKTDRSSKIRYSWVYLFFIQDERILQKVRKLQNAFSE